MTIRFVGVDIAKNVFQVHASNSRGKALWKKRLKRSEWIDQIYRHIPTTAIIAMEACSSAHHWARRLQSLGYQVKLIPAQYVKPFVKSNKNDQADAAAICEALSRDDMRFVAVKSVEQQDTQALHRIRETLMRDRTAKTNQIRGLTAEYGLVAAQGYAALGKAVPQWLEEADNGLSPRFRAQLNALYEDWQRLNERIAEMDKEIAQQVRADETAARLIALRGVGPMGASALSIELGSTSEFTRGRDFAASLGLTPRQHSSGGRDRLLGISKRGDSYLRKTLVHGARAVIRHIGERDDPLSCWIRRMLERKHPNVVAVALANKTARIAWSLIQKDQQIDPNRMAATA
jgi:transposase